MHTGPETLVIIPAVTAMGGEVCAAVGVGVKREGRAKLEVDSAGLFPAGFAEVGAEVVSTPFW